MSNAKPFNDLSSNEPSSSDSSCKDHVWKIGPYVDGELPRAEREEVEAHLRECPDCEKLTARFRTLDSLAGRDEVPPVSAEEWSRILDNVTRQSRLTALAPRHRTWEWLVPVTSLAALLAFGVFIGRGLLEGPPEGKRPTQAVTDPDKKAAENENFLIDKERSPANSSSPRGELIDR